MKITRETDYAVRIVSYLSKQTEICGAKMIALEIDVSQMFALKILRKLCMSEILQSYKGQNGGYKLKKEPKEITMLEVIEAISGKITITNCAKSDNSCCDSSCSCTLKKAFEKAEIALTEELSAHTFDNL